MRILKFQIKDQQLGEEKGAGQKKEPVLQSDHLGKNYNFSYDFFAIFYQFCPNVEKIIKNGNVWIKN